MDDTKFSQWCVLELMGHRRLAGKVTEEQIAGVGVLRLDVPGEDGGPDVTQFYAPAALSPVSEEIARAVAKQYRAEPVHQYELKQLIAATTPAAAAPRRIPDDDDDNPF